MTYRYEMKVSKKMHKELKKQHNFLIEKGEEIYKDVFLWYFSQYKTLDGIEKEYNSLESFFKSMGLYDFVDVLRDDINKVVINGYKGSYRKNKTKLGELDIDFDIQNPAVTEYMNNFRGIQLSDFKGSIPFTTKNQVIALLREGVDNNLSYGEIAKKIQELDSTLFSKNRAKLIAVRETGKAYEWGNYIPMKEARDQGADVEKKWLTVGDMRVTDECRMNERTGRVKFDHVYTYDRDDIAPRTENPRCRCAMQWRIN